VTVVNFLARDNEAQRLTFEILSQKLELFGTVLDASDQVLHKASGAPPETLSGVVGSGIEAELRRIYDRARTAAEVEAELRALRERVGEERQRFEEVHARTASTIEKHFDSDVRRVFKGHQQQVPVALAALDRDLERFVRGYLDAVHIPYERSGEAEGGVTLRIAKSDLLPVELREGLSVVAGVVDGMESLHLAHPLVLAALEEARAESSGPMAVRAAVPAIANSSLERLRGRRGRLGIVKVRYDGFEAFERLLVVAILEGEADPMPASDAEALLLGPLSSIELVGPSVIPDDVFADAIDGHLFDLQCEVGAGEQKRLERSLEQVDRAIEDRILLLRRRRDDLLVRLDDAMRKRENALGPERREAAEKTAANTQGVLDEIEGNVARLARRDDGEFRRWRDKALGRRHAVPTVARLVDVELVIE
jgi:hypothetical protein